PRYFLDISEHSMCHPGRPLLHGASQNGSPSFFGFQSTKSRGSSFSSWPDTRSSLPPDCRSSRFLRSEEHTSELQSRFDLVCRLLLEKKKHHGNSTTARN